MVISNLAHSYSTLTAKNQNREPDLELSATVVRRPGQSPHFVAITTLGQLYEFQDPDDLKVRNAADRQRGDSDVYDAQGNLTGTTPVIDRKRVDKMKELVLDGKEFYGGSLTWNIPSEEAEYQFNPQEGILRIWGVTTTPDSRHRHALAREITELILKTGHDLDPRAYEWVLLIYTVSRNAEPTIFNESNNLGKPANQTRIKYLYQADPHNRLAMNLAQHSVLSNYVEIVKNSISVNSPKVVTFNILQKGLKEAFPNVDDGNFDAIKDFMHEYLKRLVEVRKDLGPLPLSTRKPMREQTVIDTGAFWNAFLRLAGNLYEVADWSERLKFLAEPFKHKGVRSDGTKIDWCGDLFSRDNPHWHGPVLAEGPNSKFTIINRVDSRRYIHQVLCKLAGV